MTAPGGRGAVGGGDDMPAGGRAVGGGRTPNRCWRAASDASDCGGAMGGGEAIAVACGTTLPGALGRVRLLSAPSGAGSSSSGTESPRARATERSSAGVSTVPDVPLPLRSDDEFVSSDMLE